MKNLIAIVAVLAWSCAFAAASDVSAPRWHQTMPPVHKPGPTPLPPIRFRHRHHRRPAPPIHRISTVPLPAAKPSSMAPSQAHAGRMLGVTAPKPPSTGRHQTMPPIQPPVRPPSIVPLPSKGSLNWMGESAAHKAAALSEASGKPTIPPASARTTIGQLKVLAVSRSWNGGNAEAVVGTSKKRKR